MENWNFYCIQVCDQQYHYNLYSINYTHYVCQLVIKCVTPVCDTLFNEFKKIEITFWTVDKEVEKKEVEEKNNRSEFDNPIRNTINARDVFTLQRKK